MKAFLAAALLLTAVLAGCSSDKGGDQDSGAASAPPVLYLNVTAGNQTYRYTSGGASGNATSATASATATVSSTKTAAGNATKGNATKGNATKAAGNATKAISGQAPLNVTVTVGASGLPAGKAFTWSVDFGDGAGNGTKRNATATASASPSATNGTHAGHSGNATASTGAASSPPLPATLKHSYAAAGNYTLRFTLTVTGSAPVEAKAAVRATAPPANATGNGTGNATKAPPPEVTHFEFGQSLGCTGDLPVGNTCQDYADGPPGSDTDGHWIALGPSYWGWTLTSTVDQGQPAANDSDCAFVDDALAEIGNGNNGSSACAGEVPEGAAWVFIYPYAAPALAMTVDFVPTAP